MNMWSYVGYCKCLEICELCNKAMVSLEKEVNSQLQIGSSLVASVCHLLLTLMWNVQRHNKSELIVFDHSFNNFSKSNKTFFFWQSQLRLLFWERKKPPLDLAFSWGHG